MKTGVTKIIEQLGGDPPAKNQTGVDKILEILENGGGGGGLPSYTDADEGKVLGLAEGSPTEQTVIPEQSVTLTTESGSAAYYFTEADNVNIDYFKSVSVGDSCVIVINGISENCTAANFMGAVLFQTSDYYLVGYDPVQDLCGIVNLGLYEPFTITISATASVPSVSPSWVNGGGNTVITGLDDNDVLDIVAGKLMTLLGACTDSAVHHLVLSGTSGNTTEAVYNAVKAAYDNNGAVVYQLTLGDVFYYIPTKYSVTGSNRYMLELPVGNYSDAYNITLELEASKSSGDTYTLLVGGYASAMTDVSSS